MAESNTNNQANVSSAKGVKGGFDFRPGEGHSRGGCDQLVLTVISADCGADDHAVKLRKGLRNA